LRVLIKEFDPVCVVIAPIANFPLARSRIRHTNRCVPLHVFPLLRTRLSVSYFDNGRKAGQRNGEFEVTLGIDVPFITRLRAHTTMQPTNTGACVHAFIKLFAQPVTFTCHSHAHSNDRL